MWHGGPPPPPLPHGTIRNGECIAGDLNKAKSDMTIHSNVYHIHNLGEKKIN